MSPYDGERYAGRAVIHQNRYECRDRDHDRSDRYDRRGRHEDRPRRSRSRSRRRRSSSRDDPHARALASTLRRLARRQSDTPDDNGVQLVMNFGALQLQDYPGPARSGEMYGAGDEMNGAMVGRQRYHGRGLTSIGSGFRGLDLAVPAWGPGVTAGAGRLLDLNPGPGKYGYGVQGLLGDGDSGLGRNAEIYYHSGYDPTGLSAFGCLQRTSASLGMGMTTVCRQCGTRRVLMGYGGTCRECVFDNGLRERERERDRERLLERAEGRGLLRGYGPTRRVIGYGRA